MIPPQKYYSILLNKDSNSNYKPSNCKILVKITIPEKYNSLLGISKQRELEQFYVPFLKFICVFVIILGGMLKVWLKASPRHISQC